MSKKIRAIIVSAIVLVLLGGAIIALALSNKSAEDDLLNTTSINTDFVPLIREDRYKTEYLKIKNKTSEYEIKPIGENLYSIVGFEDLFQIKAYFPEALTQACSVTATKLIAEDSQSLGDFGFNDPELVFEIKTEGNDAISLTVGSTTSDGSSHYVIITGENDIYSVPVTTFPNLFMDKFDYLDKTVINGFDPNVATEIPYLNKVSITRKDLETPIVFDSFVKGDLSENAVSQSTIRMTSPVEALISETSAQDYLYGNFGLIAESIVDINPTEEKLIEYGFDDPSSVFEIKYNDNINIKVTTGNGIECEHAVDEDLTGHQHEFVSYYAMRDDSNTVYRVSTISMRWFEMQPKDIISTIAVLPSVFDLESVELTTSDDKTYTLKYETESSEDGKKSVTGATLDGKEVDSKDARQILQLLTLTDIQDLNYETPTSEAETTIKYNYLDGTNNVVELFILEDRTAVISLDGNNAFVGRPALVDKINNEIKKLESGSPVDINW